MLLAPAAVLYVGVGGCADRHAHHAVQLVWVRDGSLRVGLGARSARGRAFLVPGNVEHSFEAEGQTLALMLFERHGPRGSALHRLALARAGEDLGQQLDAVTFPSLSSPADEMSSFAERVVDALGADRERSPLSPHTRRALEYIESTLEGTPRLRDVALQIGTSETRLTHVFTREVGLPFRRYVLWARIKRAVEAVRHGSTATHAASVAGFADSAHLARTFRAMFGMPPSKVLPQLEVVGAALAVGLPRAR